MDDSQHTPARRSSRPAVRTLLTLFVVIFLLVGGVAYLVGGIAFGVAQPDSLIWSWQPTPGPLLGPGNVPFAPTDPAIIAVLYAAAPFDPDPLTVFEGVVPVGAYIPQAGVDAHSGTLTMVTLPTAAVIEQAADAGILPTPTVAFSSLGGPALELYAGDGCAPRGMPTGGILTQRFHQWHSGIDYGIPVGTPVSATHSGEVLFAGWSTVGYGNLVIIQNGAFITYYAHLSRFNVIEGQRVGAGSVIAWSGNTGNSTGPHIHYEVRINDVPVDPMSFDSRGYPWC